MCSQENDDANCTGMPFSNALEFGIITSEATGFYCVRLRNQQRHNLLGVASPKSMFLA